MNVEERYLTVSALTKYIKYKFDHDHHLDEVLLEGEISNFKHNSRGHFYFTLKDEGAQISATMFASQASRVKFEPKDGMKVFVKGNVTVYEPSGSYQINVKELKSDGIGDLYLALEKLKKELSKEGFFDEAHKKNIPLYPKTIGVVTSPTGAAIRDIIKTIERRYPYCTVILYPAIVQGEDAKKNVSQQIIRANKDNICDVLIVGRGGGSIEDLWAFNERIVAEAIYNSEIPIISAVGHEIDFTIADYVADKRAVTPTAAAELATPDVAILRRNIELSLDRMKRCIQFKLEQLKTRLVNLDQRIENNNPINALRHKEEILNSYIQRLNGLTSAILTQKKHSYDIARHRLDSVNPLKIMEKGYSINSIEGEIITDIKKANKGDILQTTMKNGILISQIIEVKENGK